VASWDIALLVKLPQIARANAWDFTQFLTILHFAGHDGSFICWNWNSRLSTKIFKLSKNLESEFFRSKHRRWWIRDSPHPHWHFSLQMVLCVYGFQLITPIHSFNRQVTDLWPFRPTLISITNTRNSLVRTSQRTNSISITNTNAEIVLREIICYEC
jgi:hypothetical protein